MHVAIIGGSAAGLSAALLLAREGHQVEVIEQDGLQPAADVEAAAKEAFRGAAPHLVQLHQIMSLARRLLQERLPDVYAALLRAGAVESPVSDRMPPTLTDRSARPGDEALGALQARRSTFDWVLRTAAAEQAGVRLWENTSATGLVVRSGAPPRVVGVRTASRDIRADVVIDAGGRRSPVIRWLAAAGIDPPERAVGACGIAYYTRHYRLRPDAPSPEPGRVSLIVPQPNFILTAVTADHDVLVAGLCPLAEDRALRGLRRPDALDAALRTLPLIGEWMGIADPISPVWAMGGLRNTLARPVGVGKANVLGLHAIGDAACTTNPTLGRGLSIALQGAVDVTEVLERHPDDPGAQASAMDALTAEHITPWFEEQVHGDKALTTAMRRHLSGQDPEPPASDEQLSPLQLRRAAAVDPELFRALMALIGMVRPPREVYGDPAVRARVGEVLASSGDRAPVRWPTRGDVLATIAASSA